MVSRTYETFVKRASERSCFTCRALVALYVFMIAVMVAAPARALDAPAKAPDNDAAVRDAARHFQRGVGLYREADYRGALVEFQRACELVPAPATLYNIGETEFQLREYAGALTAFERYLADASPDEHHRAEVEANVEVLRTRVGHVLVTTVPPAADIAIDDQAVGKTPFETPLRVSIGHHKVVASMPGRPSVQSYVDVAAEDEVSLNLSLAAPDAASASSSEDRSNASLARVDGSPGRGSSLRAAGWVTAGVLAAGGVAFGLLAKSQSNNLEQDRAVYPVSRNTLNHDATITTTYAVTADSLFAAAVIVGGITLISTLSSTSGPRVTVGLSSVRFATTF